MIRAALSGSLTTRTLTLALVMLVPACSACSRKGESSGVATPDPNQAPAPAGPPISATGALVADCKALGADVGPGLYGIAFADAPKELGATMHRWGGNTTSRYNPELGNAWSTAQDWYWQNVKIDSWEIFAAKAERSGGAAAITVPIMGWVAKDTDSYSFSIAKLGNQKEHDPEPNKRDRGNGVNLLGKPIPPPPPETTSVKITPEQVGVWVAKIKELDAKREMAKGTPARAGAPAQPGKRLVRMYFLDNEPGLWHTTHRDVHPEPMSYDELLEKTIAYATAIRKADPDALIAGPASYGWWEYFYSAKDHEAGFTNKPDRKAHGDTPLIEWYLRKLKEHEQKTGVKLLDVLDVHFYPQSEGVEGNNGEGEGTDDGTNARRLRSVRALWDPTYKDESWIDDNVQLVPRMKKIIADNYPGLKLSIGEYRFGGEQHMSGAAALGEAMGRMATGGVDYAFYWTAPRDGSAAYSAFRAYANYDGAGSKFAGKLVPVSTAKEAASVYAAKNGNKVVLVYVNRDGQKSFEEKVDLSSCGTVQSVKSFGIERSGDPRGLSPATQRTLQTGGEVSVKMPPFSVTTVEATLAP